MEQTNMAKPTIRIYDVEKDELIDREMTEVEYKVYQADQKITVAKNAQDAAKAEAKQAILDRIGLTADELKTILG
jgi:hypothetical protein